MSDPVKSPCISVCALNEENICVGCYRTAREITEWSTLDNQQRLQVLEATKERFQRSNKHHLL